MYGFGVETEYAKDFEAQLKTIAPRLFLVAGLFACVGSLALAQTANQRTKAKVKAKAVQTQTVKTPAAPIPETKVPDVKAPDAKASSTVSQAPPASATSSPASTGQAAGPNASAAGEVASSSGSAQASVAAILDEAPARAALKGGNDASLAGNGDEAVKLWRTAITLAPAGDTGDLVAMEAAKRLGFAAFERRDPRSAEAFFAGEAIIARRLYFADKITARAFADAVSRWASATGAMGRSGDSAALVFYAQEIRARAQAAASAEVLNRDANNPADDVGTVKIANSSVCIVGREPLLKDRVSCDDEAGARGEALSLQSRQIKASAPPPPTKEEREAKAAKAKKGG
jgi:hypothetical protein